MTETDDLCTHQELLNMVHISFFHCIYVLHRFLHLLAPSSTTSLVFSMLSTVRRFFPFFSPSRFHPTCCELISFLLLIHQVLLARLILLEGMICCSPLLPLVLCSLFSSLHSLHRCSLPAFLPSLASLPSPPPILVLLLPRPLLEMHFC